MKKRENIKERARESWCCKLAIRGRVVVVVDTHKFSFYLPS